MSEIQPVKESSTGPERFVHQQTIMWCHRTAASVCCCCILFARACAQPLTEVQEYLDEYSHDLRIANLPSAAEGVLLSKLLVALPVEPQQYTGQSSTTFDANSDYEGRFALLLPSLSNENDQTNLPPVDELWQVQSNVSYVSCDRLCMASRGTIGLARSMSPVVPVYA